MSNDDTALTVQEAVSQGLELINRSNFCLLGTNGEDGFPYIKGLTHLKHDGLKKFWFSTNTSSNRVRQLKKDNRACIYYVDNNAFQGLRLTGTVDILQDIESRKMLWFEGSEKYYPQGVEDPDYSVLCFTPIQANYYHALTNITFDIE
ncbi:MAG: pyridoxamine 5'-phosphate oxidase family protein [Dehalococcoidales bacterium]|nr:pyridoxamine 5'-phosphate oxidase family protein [Dehalococcoidales bacterium]